jgi:hypothetical protein
MLKKSKIGIVISILCIFIFLTGCNNIKTQAQSKGGLKINTWSSGLGDINETDLGNTKFSYSINLTNENENNIFVKSIKPSVNEKINNKIISKDIVVTVNKDIKHNETIQINGEIIVDTKGLTKSDIVQLEPFITDIKVLSEEAVSLKK